MASVRQSRFIKDISLSNLSKVDELRRGASRQRDR